MDDVSLTPEMGLFIGGAIFGYVLLVSVLVQLCYGFPRCLLWVLTGWARWYAPFLYLIRPLTWGLVLFGLWLVLILHGPGAVKNLLWTQNFLLGLAGGVILGLGRAVLSNYARRRSKEGFLKFIMPYLTDVGIANVQIRWPSSARS
jgi:hypothetical protein